MGYLIQVHKIKVEKEDNTLTPKEIKEDKKVNLRPKAIKDFIGQENLKLNLAGKTGTTNENTDAWFIGFTSNLVIGVYVGMDNPSPLGKFETGSKTALPIFKDFVKKSIKKSNITNIHHARLSDNELTEAFNGKNFRRMADIDINVFNFSHVLVDPPRSGLNNNVTQILSKFNNIIYISCNPSTFERDLVSLKGYKIKKVEVFDQFSNTSHLELIALLVKN